MNKTYHELCDENIMLREKLEAAQASRDLARLTTRQAMAKAEELERELARRRAEWQAEAVEQAANDLYDMLGLSIEQLDFLARRAKHHRRQADGGAA